MHVRNYAFSALGGISYPSPMLPLRITNPHTGKSLLAWGLVDTGASQFAIPATMAPILGHNLELGQTLPISTGNGTAAAYLHTTQIDILSLDGSTKVFSISSIPVSFMPNLVPVLIGVGNFLELFRLTIDYPHQKFSITGHPYHAGH